MQHVAATNVALKIVCRRHVTRIHFFVQQYCVRKLSRKDLEHLPLLSRDATLRILRYFPPLISTLSNAPLLILILDTQDFELDEKNTAYYIAKGIAAKPECTVRMHNVNYGSSTD